MPTHKPDGEYLRQHRLVPDLNRYKGRCYRWDIPGNDSVTFLSFTVACTVCIRVFRVFALDVISPLGVFPRSRRLSEWLRTSVIPIAPVSWTLRRANDGFEALLSVYDKTDLLELAQGLHAGGVRLIGSGGTAKKIRESGIPIE